MEQVSGVSDEMVMSKNMIYLNVYAELLVQSQLGLPLRPAPRPTLVLLAALEDYLHDTTGVVALRLQAWWHVVKARAVLRHDDHGGLRPADVGFDDEGMYSHSHWSKTTGGDKAVQTRPISVTTAAYIIYLGWVARDRLPLAHGLRAGGAGLSVAIAIREGQEGQDFPHVTPRFHHLLSPTVQSSDGAPMDGGWTRLFDPSVPLGHCREHFVSFFFCPRPRPHSIGFGPTRTSLVAGEHRDFRRVAAKSAPRFLRSSHRSEGWSKRGTRLVD